MKLFTAAVGGMLLGCLGAAREASGEVRLPGVISPGMVLQRETEVPIWGWADPGEPVAVRGSWPGAALQTATATPEGKWLVRLKTPGAGGPYVITVAGQSTVTVDDVLVGEVWVCSGQSNMEWPVSLSQDAASEIAAADFPEIRHFDVPNRVAFEPQADCGGAWRRCTPQTVPAFTAVGYFFAREVHRRLNVPVGLINATWGGTVAEAWTSEESLSPLKDFDAGLAAVRGARANPAAAEGANPNQPAVLYNGMISPVLGYGIRGALWYQGESNRGRGEQYRVLFPALIADWRARWGRGDFPFYYVQIAPYHYGNDTGQTAEIREAQAMTLSVPNTGMVVTMDIGNPADIHPANKQEVGRRLSLWAMARTYGQGGDEYSGPLFAAMTVTGPTARLTFDHADGLRACGGELTGFEVAGPDGRFVPARAVVEVEAVVVSATGVPAPAAVRYGWADAAECNLCNGAGLPASPFRTDPPKNRSVLP